jgi:hypothetical protein
MKPHMTVSVSLGASMNRRRTWEVRRAAGFPELISGPHPRPRRILFQQECFQVKIFEYETMTIHLEAA